jgi:hypothetical protein
VLHMVKAWELYSCSVVLFCYCVSVCRLSADEILISACWIVDRSCQWKEGINGSGHECIFLVISATGYCKTSQIVPQILFHHS